jgi:branched-chain amino acid transport system substrate-binding protein
VLAFVGPLAPPDQPGAAMGAALALKHINENGGINGRPLQLIVKNDEGEPEKAIAIAQELFDNPEVAAVAGHLNSSTTIAAARIYNEGLVALSPMATSPLISQLGPWIFRVVASDSANAAALAEQAVSMSKKIAILYSNDSYGRGLSDSFRQAAEAAGANILGADPLLKTTEDLTPYLERLSRRNADLIFLATGDLAGARIVAQARQMNFGVRFLGSDGIEPLVTRGNLYNGIYVGLPYHPESSPAARNFAEAFRAEFGLEADSYPAATYDAVRLLALAVETVGADRKKIRGYLEAVGRPGGPPAFEGVMGTLQFDEHGDPQSKPYSVWVMRNGELRPRATER